jgi:mRNA interferase RelE/StbE
VSDTGPYRLIIAPTARRQLTQIMPHAIAFAAYELITGALLDNAHRGSIVDQR